MTPKLIIPFLFFSFVFISCSTYKVLDSQKRFLLDENGKNKYYLIEYIKLKQMENLLGEVPTLIVHKIDGDLIVRSDKEYCAAINLKRREITRIEIIPLEKAPKIYGSAGKNGVIDVYGVMDKIDAFF